MFIDSVLQEHQAPLGAACQRRNVQWTHMPLLTELEESFYGPRFYRHGAPNGAVERGHELFIQAPIIFRCLEISDTRRQAVL